MNDKTLHIQTDFIQQDGKDTFYNHRYEPTPYDVLDNLFDIFTPDPDTCLVDYGCGPGRLNFYVEKRLVETKMVNCTKGIPYFWQNAREGKYGDHSGDRGARGNIGSDGIACHQPDTVRQ